MTNLLKYSLNIQLFAEGGEGEGIPPTPGTPPTVEIDYEKLA